ncbi:MAG: hypothetical protein ACFB20_13480 [Opitutales bacterium]
MIIPSTLLRCIVFPVLGFLALLGSGCANLERNLHLTYRPAEYPTYVLQPVEGIPPEATRLAVRDILEDEALAGVARRLDARGYEATLPENAAMNVHLRWWSGEERLGPAGPLQGTTADGPLPRQRYETRIHLQIYLADAQTGEIVWERWSVDDELLRGFNQEKLDRFLNIILDPLPGVNDVPAGPAAGQANRPNPSRLNGANRPWY